MPHWLAMQQIKHLYFYFIKRKKTQHVPSMSLIVLQATNALDEIIYAIIVCYKQFCVGVTDCPDGSKSKIIIKIGTKL